MELTNQNNIAIAAFLESHHAQDIPISVTMTPGNTLVMVISEGEIQSVVLSAIKSFYDEKSREKGTVPH